MSLASAMGLFIKGLSAWVQSRLDPCPKERNSNISPTCPHIPTMVNFGPLVAEICSGVLGTPSKFQRVSCLGSVTARHSSSGRQPNFAALNRGRHLYLALAHILVCDFLCPVFSASCVQHISNMHAKFALRPHRVEVW